ncbi:Mu-like prophage major head subunit gpT family protein [Paradevosia shaoguanensis]|uniref:Mu-like prophage major head subunit gpT family protein n=1 Tax=Paradevosia shaoguanensis TaxID=1335043 RepID=A0AA41QR07_9HYPH|nr:Mu-like prophage major head subunit gpT family protein [Paradevosia shaoguanensis]MCF1744627.1 Mu-like prophage major head subunit gpT family protein [Paradevosia shaoguanensis]MCI0129110.1 Mu-like prophage major head subunit gpT family protein [Paradevosia shaoguanensis]
MLVNRANLDSLRVGYSTAYQGGLGMATSQWSQVATLVPATQKEQKYGWLGKVPGVREWIGARLVHALEQHDYAIKEKAWELTLGVDRDDIETDNLGIYAPLFQEMGASAGAKPDELVFGLLSKGFSTECYDHQYFFDTDHPVTDADGKVTSVSNFGGGAGQAWFLMCTSRPLKPLILQRRKDFEFVAKDALTDDNVFNNKEFVYGTDARFNAGFGFWQFAYASKQDLTPANYEAARAAITGMKGDHGRPLGLVPNLLVVNSANEGAGKRILQSQLVNGGESNPWANSAQLLVSPWL